MEKCIYCKGKDFKDEIDLGPMYPSAFVPKGFDYAQVKKFETKIVSCKTCGFVQMSEMPNRDDMYREYWYRSSLNATMVQALWNIINNCYKRVGTVKRAMDIASNDATLLSMYPSSVFRVGVDPANNLAKYYTKDSCDLFINNYFDSSIHFTNEKFDIITSIAVFYDVPDPLDFVKGIAQNLDENGVWCCQMTDLYSTLKLHCEDNIVHEHLAYWTLQKFCDIIGEVGMEVFDVEYNDVNGCSIRMYVGHKDKHKIEESVENSLEQEKIVLKPGCLEKFYKEIVETKEKTVSLLNKLNSEGKKVVGMGASTKGNTILQFYNLTQDHLSHIGEVSQEKVGLCTIGSHIPIVSEKEMFSEKPDYIYLLCWHFKNMIIEKNKGYLNGGGKFIVSMPKPAIIDKDGTHLI